MHPRRIEFWYLVLMMAVATILFHPISVTAQSLAARMAGEKLAISLPHLGNAANSLTAVVTASPLPTNTLLPQPTNTPVPVATNTDAIAQVPDDDLITLPLEVIGQDGYTKSVSFTLPSAVTGATSLFMKCHRCAYNDASVNTARGPKASVRLNGGIWVGLTDAVATVGAPENAVGGIAGGWRTTRFTVPLTGVTMGTNTIEFRFNGTDGFTSGYRVLDFNILDVTGDALLPSSLFVEENPSSWQVQGTATDIQAGGQLWSQKSLLQESPLSTGVIKASCASCHATSGRDLKYFGYSDLSITERSKFHGLTAVQGAQIASYIRSLPVQSLGRPWNPPYQPGPGLDSRPQAAWAAGAGVDAVLDHDSNMQPFLFPNGIVPDAISIDKSINVREMPLSLQLPDWNDWLPEVHPEDIWGDYFLSSGTNTKNQSADVSGKYQKLTNSLATTSVNTLISGGQLKKLFDEFINAGIGYFLDGRYSDAINRIPPNYTKEFARLNMRRWTIVKTWENMHSYALEELGKRIYGPVGELRTWFSTARSVFDLAAHTCSENHTNFEWQTLLVGKYSSTAWYNLQLVLSGSNKTGGQIAPVDWNYHPNHIGNLYSVGGPAHPYRLTQAFGKMYQEFNNSKGAPGFRFQQVHPVRYLGGVMDTLPAGTKAEVYNALLTNLMSKLERHPANEWPRRSATANQLELEPATYKPVFVTNTNLGAAFAGIRYADCWYTVIPQFRAAGVNPAILERMINWGKQMWPLGNWNALG